MSIFTVVLGVVAIVLVASILWIVHKIEAHSEKTSKVKRTDLGFGHTVVSLVLWPLGFFSFSVTLIILTTLFILIPPRFLCRVLQFLCRFVLLSIGVILKINGKEKIKNPQAYILMFNHQSLFDAFIIGAMIYRYMTGLAASYHFKLPFWGYLLRRWGIIPIPRKDLKAAIKSIDIAREKLEAGIPILVAPEGTRTLTGDIREFKKGPFHLALGSHAPILPIAIKGAFEIKQKTDWRLRPGMVRVEVGDLIPYEDFNEMSVEQLRDYIRGIIQKLMSEMP